jgi:hypothetical protein
MRCYLGVVYYTSHGTKFSDIMKIHVRNAKTNKFTNPDEVVIEANPAEMRRLARFLLHGATAIAKHKGNFGHAHLQDFRLGKNERKPDVIIVPDKCTDKPVRRTKAK